MRSQNFRNFFLHKFYSAGSLWLNYNTTGNILNARVFAPTPVHVVDHESSQLLRYRIMKNKNKYEMKFIINSSLRKTFLQT